MSPQEQEPLSSLPAHRRNVLKGVFGLAVASTPAVTSVALSGASTGEHGRSRAVLAPDPTTTAAPPPTPTIAASDPLDLRHTTTPLPVDRDDPAR